MSADKLVLFDAADFKLRLAQHDNQLDVFRSTLEHARLTLDQCFLDGRDIEQLVHARAMVVDQIISNAWIHFGLENHSN